MSTLAQKRARLAEIRAQMIAKHGEIQERQRAYSESPFAIAAVKALQQEGEVLEKQALALQQEIKQATDAGALEGLVMQFREIVNELVSRAREYKQINIGNPDPEIQELVKGRQMFADGLEVVLAMAEAELRSAQAGY